MVGLFEAAVDELCTWPLPAARETGPKIVASTATTKRAREQVRGVFGAGPGGLPAAGARRRRHVLLPAGARSPPTTRAGATSASARTACG